MSLILLSLTAITVHELGHIIAIYALGGGVSRITVSPFGLTIHRKTTATSYSADAVIALAGCTANVVTGAAAYVASGFTAFTAISLAYAAFNLCPVSTLDGGAALYAVIMRFAREEETAGRVLKYTSGVFIVLLWIAGVYLILRPECGASLFFVTVYLFCSIYLK